MLRRLLEALGYGCPPHPAIYQKADGWYCTECHQKVA